MRDVVRSELGGPGRLAGAFDAMSEAELAPWYRATLDVDRAFVNIVEVFSRPGRADRIMSIAQSEPPLQVPGPSRQELLQLVA